MAKIKPIYLIGAAALAAYLFRDKLFGKSTDQDQPGDDQLTEKEANTTDAIIDTTKSGQTVTQAIETAKQIAKGYKDIKVLIKTPPGEKNIAYTRGEKTPSARKKKRLEKRATKKLTRAEKIKKRRSRKKKAEIKIGPTQSSFTPFTSTSDVDDK